MFVDSDPHPTPSRYQMDVAVKVIGATCAVIAGCIASTRDLKDFEGHKKWYSYTKLVVWSGLVYGGYLGALGVSSWALGSGAAPAMVPACILVVRYFVRRHMLNKLGKHYADQYPLSTLTEDTSFEQALSVPS
jgi:hypothetical protein